jgi:hypothetical protein
MMTDPSMESQEWDGGDDNVDADYYNLELGMNMGGILAGIGYEYQSGMTYGEYDSDGDNKIFSTPLGTNHKFNGWADQFLGTPDQGLKDLNAHLGYTSKSFGTFKVVYHKFDSAEESISYGDEWDLVYKRAIPGVKGLTGMLKFADYNGDDKGGSYHDSDDLTEDEYKKINPKATDVQKFWVMLDYKFTSK